MKRTMKFLAMAFALAMFAVPALAQTQECNDENKGTWYKTFYDNFRGTAEQQKTAAESAKTYIAACPADPADKQREYMQKFVTKWDELQGNADVAKKFQDAVTSKNYPDQIKYGKLLLAKNPDNEPVNIYMGVAGLSDPNVLQDSAQAAKKAISLIEAGKPFAPIATKEQALAYLNYTVAQSLKSSPAEAIPYFLQTLRHDSDLKKNWQVYYQLQEAYEKGPVAKLTADYKSKIGPNNTETPDSKLALENVYKMVDNQIDALARAAALADAANKQALVSDLTELYKYRNGGKDAGLTDLMATVLNKPIPDVPAPVTSLPGASTTPGASTPGATDNGNVANNGGTGVKGVNQNVNTSTTNKTGTSTTTPAVKKPNHR